MRSIIPRIVILRLVLSIRIVSRMAIVSIVRTVLRVVSVIRRLTRFRSIRFRIRITLRLAVVTRIAILLRLPTIAGSYSSTSENQCTCNSYRPSSNDFGLTQPMTETPDKQLKNQNNVKLHNHQQMVLVIQVRQPQQQLLRNPQPKRKHVYQWAR